MLISLLAVFLALLLKGQNKADAICGCWYTTDKMAIVKIFQNEENGFNGEFIWLKDSIETDEGSTNYGKPVKDYHTGLPLLGTAIVRDLHFKGDGVWKGKIYNPLTGKKVDCMMHLSEDKCSLVLRGYVGVKWLGKTVKWKSCSDEIIGTNIQQPGKLTKK